MADYVSVAMCILSAYLAKKRKRRLDAIAESESFQALLDMFFDSCHFDSLTNLMFGFDEYEDECLLSLESPNKKVRRQDRVEDSLQRYPLSDFKKHFRLSKTTVEAVIVLYGHVQHRSIVGRPQLPETDIVLIGIWSLANQETYRQISDRFGVANSTAHDVFVNFCMALHSIRGKLISWPTNDDDLARISRGFEEKAGFPGVVGAMDSCQVAIKAPKMNKEAYLNQNKLYSVNVLATVDSSMTFLDVFAGWCGSTHDSEVYRNSPLFRKLETHTLPFQYHVVADSAFPISHFLLTPFKNDGFLDPKRENYNLRHSSTRLAVERAFGLLKGKFRKLQYLDVNDSSKHSKIIMAACVLHNIYVTAKDWEEDEIIVEIRPDGTGDELPDSANSKRDAIVDYLGNKYP